MPVAPSFDDLINQGRAEILARRPDLALLDGDVTVAMLHASGAMADAVLRYAAQSFRERFLDGARDDALTALVNDLYGLTRTAATSAQVTLTVTATGAGTLAAGTQVATAIGADGSTVVFTTDADVITVGAGTPTVTATAVEAGRAGNVAAGTLTRILTTAPSGWTVSNATAAAGGNEVETDDELRQRARAFGATLRRATLAAIVAGALQVPAVRVARAAESFWQTSYDGTSVLAPGVVDCYVSDADGNSTALMVADVVTELANWRAAGVAVAVVGGTRTEVDVTVTVELEDGVSLTALTAGIQAAVTAVFARQQPGRTVTGDRVTAAVMAVDDGIISITLSYSSGDPITVVGEDIEATTGQVLRAGTVTVVEA